MEVAETAHRSERLVRKEGFAVGSPLAELQPRKANVIEQSIIASCMLSILQFSDLRFDSPPTPSSTLADPFLQFVGLALATYTTVPSLTDLYLDAQRNSYSTLSEF
ncbi:MAG: hypothetical protein Q9186_005494 [Xanthomendoza sp. 1 TL-2023]